MYIYLFSHVCSQRSLFLIIGDNSLISKELFFNIFAKNTGSHLTDMYFLPDNIINTILKNGVEPISDADYVREIHKHGL